MMFSEKTSAFSRERSFYCASVAENDVLFKLYIFSRHHQSSSLNLVANNNLAANPISTGQGNTTQEIPERGRHGSLLSKV